MCIGKASAAFHEVRPRPFPPRRARMTTPRHRLRAMTVPDHEALDAAFGRFELQGEGYARFLRAHARALPTLEAQAAAAPWAGPPRASLLLADLRALGREPPPPLAPTPDEAQGWAGPDGGLGLAYVLEGSRLGGILLSRRIAPGRPGGFLGAAHAPGAWSGFTAELDRALSGRADALDAALAGARAAFRFYLRAAEAEAAEGGPAHVPAS